MSSSFLFNPGVPGTPGGKKARRWLKPKGRPKGAKDKKKRKKPDRAHLRKGVREEVLETGYPDGRRVLSMEELRRLEKELEEQDAAKDKQTEEDKPAMSPNDERHRKPDIEWPCTVACVAKKFAGKTTALLNMKDEITSYFDNVFVITKTKHKHNLDELASSPDHILSDMSEEFIELLLEHQEETQAKTLMIWDDFIGMEFEPRYSKQLKLLAASGRNFELSMWFSSQDLVEIPTIIRRNSEYLLLGNNYESTIDGLAKQLALPGMGKRQFRLLLEKISKRKDHEFLYVDDRNQDWWVWKPEEMEGLSKTKPDPKFDMNKKRKRNDAEDIAMSRAAQDAKRTRKD